MIQCRYKKSQTLHSQIVVHDMRNLDHCWKCNFGQHAILGSLVWIWFWSNFKLHCPFHKTRNGHLYTLGMHWVNDFEVLDWVHLETNSTLEYSIYCRFPVNHQFRILSFGKCIWVSIENVIKPLFIFLIQL